MAAWFTVVAPFLPDIIQMAKPMFTRDKGAEQVPQQIKELQDAATQNAGAVKQLAGEMQRTLASLQQGASQLDNTLVALQQRNAVLVRELRRANRFEVTAATAAMLAFPPYDNVRASWWERVRYYS